VTGTNEARINVKEHTDPSLFVLEPFLADAEGLQIRPAPELLPILPSEESCDGKGGGAAVTIADDDGDSSRRHDDHGWITCDGNGQSSVISRILAAKGAGRGGGDKEDVTGMILFVGRAFATKSMELKGRKVVPTLHRVIGPLDPTGLGRRTVLYEQKYEEFFPPPILD